MRLFFIVLLAQITISTASAVTKNMSEVKYKDKLNGLSWLKDDLSAMNRHNGCADINDSWSLPDIKYDKCSYVVSSTGGYKVDVADSRAEKYCLDLSARLPTLKEYQSLIRNFDHIEKNGWPELTRKGREEMENNLGGYLSDGGYWTPTIDANPNLPPPANDSAFVFLPWAGTMGSLPRYFTEYVRCVID